MDDNFAGFEIWDFTRKRRQVGVAYHVRGLGNREYESLRERGTLRARR